MRSARSISPPLRLMSRSRTSVTTCSTAPGSRRRSCELRRAARGRRAGPGRGRAARALVPHGRAAACRHRVGERIFAAPGAGADGCRHGLCRLAVIAHPSFVVEVQNRRERDPQHEAGVSHGSFSLPARGRIRPRQTDGSAAGASSRARCRADSVALDGRVRVARAARVKAAAGSEERTQGPLVHANEAHQQLAHGSSIPRAIFFQCSPRLARRSRARRKPRRLARGDRDIDRGQDMLIQAEGFARHALDEIASDGAAAAARRDRQPQARMMFHDLRARTK